MKLKETTAKELKASVKASVEKFIMLNFSQDAREDLYKRDCQRGRLVRVKIQYSTASESKSNAALYRDLVLIAGPDEQDQDDFCKEVIDEMAETSSKLVSA